MQSSCFLIFSLASMRFLSPIISLRCKPCLCGIISSLGHLECPLPLPPQPFLQTHKPVIPNHEMIHQFYIKHLPRLNKLLRYRDILRRRGRITAGVVMANNDSRTVTRNRWSVNLGGTQDGTVHGALVAADVID